MVRNGSSGNAAGGRSEQAMVSHVAGKPTDDRALDATARLSGGSCKRRDGAKS